MEKALKAVLYENFSIREAAETYDAPKSTLGDRVCGKVLPGSISGHSGSLVTEKRRS